MNLALMVGAPVFVTYQMSDTAVILEMFCMSGRRLEIVVDGEMLREMQGPERGVSRRMTESSVM